MDCLSEALVRKLKDLGLLLSKLLLIHRSDSWCGLSAEDQSGAANLSNHTRPLQVAGTSSEYNVCIPRANIMREREKKMRGREGERLLMQSILPFKTQLPGTSLVVQGLRLHAPSGGGQGSIPSQGTRSHGLQLRVCMPQLKNLPATTKSPTCLGEDQRSHVHQLRLNALE